MYGLFLPIAISLSVPHGALNAGSFAYVPLFSLVAWAQSSARGCVCHALAVRKDRAALCAFQQEPQQHSVWRKLLLLWCLCRCARASVPCYQPLRAASSFLSGCTRNHSWSILQRWDIMRFSGPVNGFCAEALYMIASSNRLCARTLLTEPWFLPCHPP